MADPRLSTSRPPSLVSRSGFFAEVGRGVFLWACFSFFLSQETLTVGLFCWLSINSWILHLCAKPQLRLHKMKHHTTLGNWKVFSIITHYMCLANQKHLRWIKLKEPQNIPKIGVTHAGSETQTVFQTHAHTLEGYTAPLSERVYLWAVFLAGHSCGNEYQMWFGFHKSKPFAALWLSFPLSESTHWGSVHYTCTWQLNSFLLTHSEKKSLSWFMCLYVPITGNN